MAIGIKSSDLNPKVLHIHEARFCRACEICVGTLNCPLCNEETVIHPESDFELEDELPWYCWRCGNPFPVSELRVEPWSRDPYIQTDDGGLITACCPCIQAEDEGR